MDKHTDHGKKILNQKVWYKDIPPRNSIRISKVAISSRGQSRRSARCWNVRSYNLYLHWFPIKLNIVVSFNRGNSIWSSWEDYFCRSLRKIIFVLNYSRTQRILQKDQFMQNLTRYLRSPTSVIMYSISLQVTNLWKQFLHIVSWL